MKQYAHKLRKVTAYTSIATTTEVDEKLNRKLITKSELDPCWMPEKWQQQ